ESEKSIQVQNILLLNRNRRPHRIVVLLLVRNYDIQSISRTSLEQDYQLLLFRRCRRHLRQNAPRQERRNRRSADQRQRPTLHKPAPAHPTLSRIAPVNVATPIAA